MKLSKGYFIAWPDDRRRSPKIARFRDWLLAEAAADADIAAEIALNPA
jgi:LysR family glycine cleavage system transcriptional activator